MRSGKSQDAKLECEREDSVINMLEERDALIAEDGTEVEVIVLERHAGGMTVQIDDPGHPQNGRVIQLGIEKPN